MKKIILIILAFLPFSAFAETACLNPQVSSFASHPGEYQQDPAYCTLDGVFYGGSAYEADGTYYCLDYFSGQGFSCHATIAPTPQDITGFFSSPVSVSSGSYNWTITLNLSQSGHIDDIQSIQIWDAFTITSATTSSNQITLNIQPTISPLAVQCTTYTLTIPSSLIQGNDGVSANASPITGSFSVTGCPTPPTTDTGSTDTGSTAGSGFIPPSASGSYIPIAYNQNGTVYFDLYGLLYVFVFIVGSLSVFIILFSIYRARLFPRLKSLFNPGKR